MPRSYLWRTLGATEPIFTVEDGTAAGGTINDYNIISIGIEAGTTMYGLSTAAATVEVDGFQAYLPSDNSPMRVLLTPYGAGRLATITGKSIGSLTHRFTGRVVAHDVSDAGTRRDIDPPDRTAVGAQKLRTTLTGQDWPSFISQIDKGAYATRSEPNMWHLYHSLFDLAQIPSMYTLQPWGSEWHWFRFTAEEDALHSKLISTSDVISRYAADVGSLIRQDRAGLPTAWSHDHLIALAASWRDTHPNPLQRAQVLSPVKWRRPATIPTSLRWGQKREIGNHDSGIIVEFAADPDITTRFEFIDMNHIWDIGWSESTGSGLIHIMRARYFRERGTDLLLEDVTVDLLGLIRRGTDADLAQVGQLLTLNHGDPIALGYDWPLVQGVHFVEKVAHKITRDAWTVTLTLVPALHVTGNYSPSDLAGRTWETAYRTYHEWQTPDTPWEASP